MSELSESSPPPRRSVSCADRHVTADNAYAVFRYRYQIVLALSRKVIVRMSVHRNTLDQVHRVIAWVRSIAHSTQLSYDVDDVKPYAELLQDCMEVARAHPRLHATRPLGQMQEHLLVLWQASQMTRVVHGARHLPLVDPTTEPVVERTKKQRSRPKAKTVTLAPTTTTPSITPVAYDQTVSLIECYMSLIMGQNTWFAANSTTEAVDRLVRNFNGAYQLVDHPDALCCAANNIRWTDSKATIIPEEYVRYVQTCWLATRRHASNPDWHPVIYSVINRNLIWFIQQNVPRPYQPSHQYWFERMVQPLAVCPAVAALPVAPAPSPSAALVPSVPPTPQAALVSSVPSTQSTQSTISVVPLG